MTKTNKAGGSRKKTTLWNYLFLNVGFVILVVNGILIVPLYLHYIGSAVYGAWLATGNILNWITIVDPGVSGVILQRVAHANGKNDKTEVGLAVASGVAISMVLFALSLVLGYTISFFIDDIAKIDTKFRVEIISSFRIAIWGTAFSLLANTFTNVVLAYQKTKIHGFFLNGINITAIIINVCLLLTDFGVYSLAYTSLFRGFATLLYSVIVSRYLIKKDNVFLKFELVYFKSFSKIFTYTFSSRLFDIIASNIDLIVVSRYLGSHYVTVLDLCRRPIKIATSLSNNITISMLPALSHLFGAGDAKTIQTVALRIWRVILWLSAFIIGGFILFNHSLIITWVGKELWIGNTNNIVLCISFLLLAIGYNLSNITYSMGDIKNNSLINIVRNVVYLITLYFLSKAFGLTGVLLSFAIPLFILLAYYPKKVCQIAFFTKNNIRAVVNETSVVGIIIAVCSILSYSINIEVSFAWLIGLAALYAAFYIGMLFLFSKGFKGEMAGIRRQIISRINPSRLGVNS